MLSLYLPTITTGKAIPDKRICSSGHIDLTRLAVFLHTRCSVDRIAPDIVGEFAEAHQPGNHRARVQADAQFEGGQALRFPSARMRARAPYELTRMNSSGMPVASVKDSMTGPTRDSLRPEYTVNGASPS